jgi:hypothetical protein
MGKVAKVLGVGVKGGLEVLVERDVIDAGDLVEGVVVLRVTKPIQCRGASMVLCSRRPCSTDHCSGH